MTSKPTDDDPECTDCRGTGVAIQTERRCACQPPAAVQAVIDTASGLLRQVEREIEAGRWPSHFAYAYRTALKGAINNVVQP